VLTPTYFLFLIPLFVSFSFSFFIVTISVVFQDGTLFSHTTVAKDVAVLGKRHLVSLMTRYDAVDATLLVLARVAIEPILNLSLLSVGLCAAAVEDLRLSLDGSSGWVQFELYVQVEGHPGQWRKCVKQS